MKTKTNQNTHFLILFLLSVLSLSVLLTGCGKSDSDNPDSILTETETKSDSESSVSVSVNGITYDISSLYDPDYEYKSDLESVMGFKEYNSVYEDSDILLPDYKEIEIDGYPCYEYTLDDTEFYLESIQEYSVSDNSSYDFKTDTELFKLLTDNKADNYEDFLVRYNEMMNEKEKEYCEEKDKENLLYVVVKNSKLTDEGEEKAHLFIKEKFENDINDYLSSYGSFDEFKNQCGITKSDKDLLKELYSSYLYQYIEQIVIDKIITLEELDINIDKDDIDVCA